MQAPAKAYCRQSLCRGETSALSAAVGVSKYKKMALFLI